MDRPAVPRLTVFEYLELAAERVGRPVGDLAGMQSIQSGLVPPLTAGCQQGEAHEQDAHGRHYITDYLSTDRAILTIADMLASTSASVVAQQDALMLRRQTKRTRRGLSFLQPFRSSAQDHLKWIDVDVEWVGRALIMK